MVTFQTNTSSTVKKIQISISLERNHRKQCLCYLLFLKWWKPRFLISERVFHRFLPNYKEFAHETSHTQPSKSDSSGTKISICLKKFGGMRLWIGTSTFKLLFPVETHPLLLLFLHSILFEIVHNLSFCDNCVDLIDL